GTRADRPSGWPASSGCSTRTWASCCAGARRAPSPRTWLWASPVRARTSARGSTRRATARTCSTGATRVWASASPRARTVASTPCRCSDDRPESLQGRRQPHRVVEITRPRRSRGPLPKRELTRDGSVGVLDLAHPGHHTTVGDHQAHLVVECERAHVHVARAEDRDVVVDREVLRVQDVRLGVQPDPDPGLEELSVVGRLSVTDHELVRLLADEQ